MSVFLWREQSEEIVVFMYWLAIVTAVLLVPPICSRVAELAFDRWGADVASVLLSAMSVQMTTLPEDRRS